MKEKTIRVVAVLAALTLQAEATSADVSADEANGDSENVLDEVVVVGHLRNQVAAIANVAEEPLLDTAMVLERLPGAAANTNGRITGIAQYRGMYGDRVAVIVDGAELIGGGPNAMDSPLSYASPMITEELTLERGIPGVASAPESIGGRISANLARGRFAGSAYPELSGMLGTRYSGNGNLTMTAGRLTLANDTHKGSVVAESDRSEGVDTPAGRILPSRVQRDRFDLSYAYSGATTKARFFAGGLDTEDTGTPALAMDIRSIDTVIAGASLETQLTPRFTIDATLGANDVEHGMDNFSLRPAPASPMAYRENQTEGSGFTFQLAGSTELGNVSLRAGIDTRRASHESRITNPNNPAFLIRNFDDLDRDVDGAFAVVSRESRSSLWELGLRYKRVSMATGAVAAEGLPAMMAMQADRLSAAFNAAERSRRFSDVDAVIKYRYMLSPNLSASIDAGSKTRAPSYQELYLWLPLAATGGLADGRSYIGDLALSAERSNEIVLGLHWSGSRLKFSPQVFYRDVADYIQGVPATNMSANMLATMMTGQGALQFSNVEAEIYGYDLEWRYESSERTTLDGSVSYTRGRRTDAADNLYRLSPLSAKLAINFADRDWSMRTEFAVYDSQHRVSAYNQESTSAGYALLNGMLAWNATEHLKLELQVENIFDRRYQGHLAGVNRVSNADIPVGERLYGIERSLVLGAILTF